VQLKCCQHGPPGMILLGHRRAKHGGEAIMCVGGNGSLVIPHDLLDQPEHRLHQTIHGLRAQAHSQILGVGYPAAQDSHGLIFPVGSVQDAIGCVGRKASRSVGWCGGVGKRWRLLSRGEP
jgi:hypothetical protein